MYTSDLASCAASTSSHNFVTNKKLVKRPAVCEHCLGFCWGVGYMIAVSCTDCKKSIHLSCAAQCEDGCGISRKPSSKRPKLNLNTFKVENEKSLRTLHCFIDTAIADNISDEEIILLLKNILNQLHSSGPPKIQSSLLEVLLFFRTRIDFFTLVAKTNAQMHDLLLSYLQAHKQARTEGTVLTVDTEYLYIVVVACVTAYIEDSKKHKSTYETFVSKGLFPILQNIIQVSSNPEWYRQLYLLQCALLSRLVNSTKIRFDLQHQDHKELLMHLWYCLNPEQELKSLKSIQWTEIGFMTNNPGKELGDMGIQALLTLVHIVTNYKNLFREYEEKTPHHPFALFVTAIGRVLLDRLLNKKATITLKNARAGGYGKLLHYFLFSNADVYEELVASLTLFFADFRPRPCLNSPPPNSTSNHLRSPEFSETIEKVTKTLDTVLHNKLLTVSDVERELGIINKQPKAPLSPPGDRVSQTGNKTVIVLPGQDHTHKKTISKRKERKPIHHDKEDMNDVTRDGGIKKYFQTFSKKKGTLESPTKNEPTGVVDPESNPNPRKKPKIATQLELGAPNDLEAGSASGWEGGVQQPRFLDAGSSRGDFDSYGQALPMFDPQLFLRHGMPKPLANSASGAQSRQDSSPELDFSLHVPRFLSPNSIDNDLSKHEWALDLATKDRTTREETRRFSVGLPSVSPGYRARRSKSVDEGKIKRIAKSGEISELPQQQPNFHSSEALSESTTHSISTASGAASAAENMQTTVGFAMGTRSAADSRFSLPDLPLLYPVPLIIGPNGLQERPQDGYSREPSIQEDYEPKPASPRSPSKASGQEFHVQQPPEPIRARRSNSTAQHHHVEKGDRDDNNRVIPHSEQLSQLAQDSSN